MEFNEHKPIYLQIADNLCDKILSGEWQPEERIPSVRELGIVLGVNPNTIMRTYEHLQSADVIFNKRGVGYYIKRCKRDNYCRPEKSVLTGGAAKDLKTDGPSWYQSFRSSNII